MKKSAREAVKLEAEEDSGVMIDLVPAGDSKSRSERQPPILSRREVAGNPSPVKSFHKLASNTCI